MVKRLAGPCGVAPITVEALSVARTTPSFILTEMAIVTAEGPCPKCRHGHGASVGSIQQVPRAPKKLDWRQFHRLSLKQVASQSMIPIVPDYAKLLLGLISLWDRRGHLLVIKIS